MRGKGDTVMRDLIRRMEPVAPFTVDGHLWDDDQGWEGCSVRWHYVYELDQGEGRGRGTGKGGRGREDTAECYWENNASLDGQKFSLLSS